MSIVLGWWLFPALVSAWWVHGVIMHSADDWAALGAIIALVPVLLAWVVYLALRVAFGVV